MKKTIIVIAILLGVVLLFVLSFVAYINFKSPAVNEVPKLNLKVELTPERIANGKRMAAMLCIQCHSAEDANILMGKQLKDAPAEFGKIFSKNITHDVENGIGGWSDGELFVMIRTGLKPNGTTGLFMPKFPLMADEDVKDIIAWLRSDSPGLAANKQEAPPSEPSLLSKFLREFVFLPLPLPQAEISRPDTNNLVALGDYVVNKQIACYACHSSDFKTINELEPTKSGGYCAGGNPMLNLKGETVVSSNLTFDESGLANYTEEEFIQAVKFGKKRNGEMVKYPMIPHTQLTDREVKGIYAYLKTIPKLKKPEVKQ